MNKKDVVSKIILGESLDICCLQEIDIPCSYNYELLTFSGYDLLIWLLKNRNIQDLHQPLSYMMLQNSEI